MKIPVMSILNPALLVSAMVLTIPAFAQNQTPSDVFDLSKVKFQIVDATFVTKLDSEKAQFTETKPDEYHGLILTVQVTKAPGDQVTVTCQDIALHYRYAGNTDVARCFGLSSYTTRQDEDRVMSLYSQGWGKTTTGLATTKSAVVYLDIFFQNMEPTTSDLYLFMAQPTGAHFVSQGWKKN